ncbi:MAG: hypothetical protein JXJ17_01000 [Anaerolineae bacterium]|nr:hypothetical protein [Anaerolineae bacterium]
MHHRTFTTFSLKSLKEIAVVLASAAILANIIIFAAGSHFSLVNKAEASSTTFDSAISPTAFTISDVEYQVSPSGPDNLKSVSFTASSPNGAAPAGVKIRLVQGSSTWFTCSPISGGGWYCPISGLSIEDTDVFETSVTQ